MKFQLSPFYTARNSDDSSARMQAWLEIEGPLLQLQALVQETFEASPCDMYIVSVAKTALMTCQHEAPSSLTVPLLLASSFYKLSAVIRAVEGGPPEHALLQRISHGFENGLVPAPPKMHDMEEAHCCTFGYSPHDSSQVLSVLPFQASGKTSEYAVPGCSAMVSVQ